MNWFDVDKAGLAATLERRGKAFAIFELVQNAWDSGATAVDITLTPIDGVPFARLTVTDNSREGWADLDHAFTMFAKSSRAANAEKRGRFNLGEKLVIACCRNAMIGTMGGTVYFDVGGRRRTAERRECGTRFEAEIRMTRDELAECERAIANLIPPVDTTYNGAAIARPKLLGSFVAKLPTEIQDDDGMMRRSVRQTTVEAFEGDGDVLELGIPIQSLDCPWRLNVLQKVPLGFDRDSVTDAFRRALQVAALNAMAETVTEEQAAAPWASEAIGDSRIAPAALQRVVVQRFGERAVVAVPGDPVANATAEANGYQVIHGGAMSGDAWANIRKHSLIPSTSQSFPTPRPSAAGESVKVCPLCKQPVRV